MAAQALPAELPALLAVLLVFVLGWAWLRPPRCACCTPTRPITRNRAREIAIVLVATAVAASMWITNPYAAALLIPALHIWLFALGPDLRMPRAARVLVVGLGILPVAAVAFTLARSLGLGASTPHGSSCC